MATLEMRPRSSTEIVDAAFQLMRTNYVPLVTLCVAAQLPLLVVRIMANRIPTSPVATPAELLAAAGPVLMLIPLIAIVSFGAQIAVMVGASQVYLGQTLDSGAAIGRALGRIGWVILAYVILIPVIFVGFILLIVPGVYISLRLMALNSVLALEDLGPFESIRRAWDLGREHVGHMFVTLFLGGIIYGAVGLVVQIFVVILGQAVPALKDPNVVAVFTTAAAAVVYPLVITISVVLYYDLRIRVEGLDVEMMAKSIGT